MVPENEQKLNELVTTYIARPLAENAEDLAEPHDTMHGGCVARARRFAKCRAYFAQGVACTGHLKSAQAMCGCSVHMLEQEGLWWSGCICAVVPCRNTDWVAKNSICTHEICQPVCRSVFVDLSHVLSGLVPLGVLKTAYVRISFANVCAGLIGQNTEHSMVISKLNPVGTCSAACREVLPLWPCITVFCSQ